MKLEILNRKKAHLDMPFCPNAYLIKGNLEGRRCWLKTGGLQFEPTKYNLEQIRHYVPDVEITGKVKNEFTPTKIATYTPKTKLFNHQKLALDKSQDKMDFAYFCDQGTGKTKIAIDRAGQLHSQGHINTVLVIAGKGVHAQWVMSQLPLHCGTEYRANYWGDKFDDFYSIPFGTLYFYTINYDALRGKKGEQTWKRLLDARGNFMLVLDDSHNVKNYSSIRWKNCHEISSQDSCVSRILLTGTPIAKNLEDEWAQFKLLDEDIIGIRYITNFRTHYSVMNEYSQTIGSRNVEQFKKLTKPYVYRARKSDFDMPPKIYDEWRFTMTDRQRQLMKEYASGIITDIETGEIRTIMHATVRVLRLQQISNGYITDKEEPIQHLFNSLWDNPRIIALHELLDSIDDDSILIWCDLRKT